MSSTLTMSALAFEPKLAELSGLMNLKKLVNGRVHSPSPSRAPKIHSKGSNSSREQLHVRIASSPKIFSASPTRLSSVSQKLSSPQVGKRSTDCGTKDIPIQPCTLSRGGRIVTRDAALEISSGGGSRDQVSSFSCCKISFGCQQTRVASTVSLPAYVVEQSESVKTDLRSLPDQGPQQTNHHLQFPTISPIELASKLRTYDPLSSFLLLDCRSFLQYNSGHVSGALNLCCTDRCSKKRLLGGKVRLEHLVGGQEGTGREAAAGECKRRLRERDLTAEIVVYDESTCEVDSWSGKVEAVNVDSSPLEIVLMMLMKNGHKAAFLKGGFQEFRAAYGEYCMDAIKNTNHVTTTSPEDASVLHGSCAASEILSFLYIGGEEDATNEGTLKKLGITHVLNVTTQIPFCDSQRAAGIARKRIPAVDNGQQNLRQFFDESFQFIESARVSNGRVLVHCQAGVSRSATIGIAYVLRRSLMTVSEAYNFVKAKRAIVAPNFSFMGQLMDFQKALDRGECARMLDPPLANVDIHEY